MCSSLSFVSDISALPEDVHDGFEFEQYLADGSHVQRCHSAPAIFARCVSDMVSENLSMCQSIIAKSSVMDYIETAHSLLSQSNVYYSVNAAINFSLPEDGLDEDEFEQYQRDGKHQCESLLRQSVRGKTSVVDYVEFARSLLDKVNSDYRDFRNIVTGGDADGTLLPEPSLASMSLHSVAESLPHVYITEVGVDDFARSAIGSAHVSLQNILYTVIRIASACKGGCAFVVAPQSAFEALQQRSSIDFQAVDKCCERWPRGYMSTRLRTLSAEDPIFMEAMQEFSEHTDDDRWPPNHNACGLPKDGVAALIDVSGHCLKAAVRLTGLPTPPFRWDCVGTRHLACLSVSWCLREYPSAVVIRSSSGRVHCLLSRSAGAPLIIGSGPPL